MSKLPVSRELLFYGVAYSIYIGCESIENYIYIHWAIPSFVVLALAKTHPYSKQRGRDFTLLDFAERESRVREMAFEVPSFTEGERLASNQM